MNFSVQLISWLLIIQGSCLCSIDLNKNPFDFHTKEVVFMKMEISSIWINLVNFSEKECPIIFVQDCIIHQTPLCKSNVAFLKRVHFGWKNSFFSVVNIQGHCGFLGWIIMIEVYVSLDLTKVFPEIFRGLSHTMFVQIGVFTLMKL